MLTIAAIVNMLQLGAQVAATGKQMLDEFHGEMSSEDQDQLKALLEKHKEENDSLYAVVQAKLTAAGQQE